MLRTAVLANPRQIDSLIRLQILEGALGFQPGHFRGDFRRGFREMSKSFPTVNPVWFSQQGNFFASTFQWTIKQILDRSNIREVVGTEDDVAINILQGLSFGGLDLAEKGNRFFAVGVKASKEILEGSDPESVQGVVRLWTKQATFNYIKKYQTQKGKGTRSLDEMMSRQKDDAQEFAPSTSHGMSAQDPRELVLDMLRDPRSRGYRVARAWLLQLAETLAKSKPGVARTVEVWVDLVSRHPDVKNRDIAEVLGVTEQAIGQAMKYFETFMESQQVPPSVQNEIELVEDAAAMGMSGLRRASQDKHAAAMSRMAHRVVFRYLNGLV